MHYFTEITCLQDQDVTSGFVMGKVMSVLHLCLVNLEKSLGTNPVGVSFPEYRYDDEVKQMGTKIRLFSQDETHLTALGLKQQLQRFDDYVHVRSVGCLERPGLMFATFERVQPKSSRERLIRRQARRRGLPEDQVRQQYLAFEEEYTALPYVNMKSHSSNSSFRLFVKKQTAQHGKAWQFSTYGLSSTVPVPDF